MNEIKLNLSGHQNGVLEDLGYIFPGTIQLNVELSFQENLEKTVVFLKNQGITSGSTVKIAVPGMSLLATITLVAIHGLTGQFPTVAVLTRTQDGSFTVTEEVDLQVMRNHVTRNLREQVISL